MPETWWWIITGLFGAGGIAGVIKGLYLHYGGRSDSMSEKFKV
jgi:hypothetical protein